MAVASSKFSDTAILDWYESRFNPGFRRNVANQMEAIATIAGTPAVGSASRAAAGNAATTPPRATPAQQKAGRKSRTRQGTLAGN